MSNGGTLTRSFGIDFDRHLGIGRVVAGVGPLGNIGGEICEPLHPAEGLDVPIQNLIGGRRTGRKSLLRTLDFIWIVGRRSAVLLSETWGNFGAIAVTMARITGHLT